MELYYIISILDRDKRNRQEKIYKALGLKISMVMMGRGTATHAHLAKHGLTLTEKAVVSTVADRGTVSLLFRQTKQKMYIDIPGNGIMVSIPIKSVGGTSTLEQLTSQTAKNSGKPDMSFEYELIYVILNEGHSDEVMDVARPAGAAGGTVISAKGTGINQTVKLKGLSLADRKEVILIVAKADNKADIMRAIIENAGTQTPAGAICFSLPVSEVAGLRRMEE